MPAGPAGWPRKAPGLRCQATRAVPGPSVLGIKHVAGQVHPEPPGDRIPLLVGITFPFRRNPEAPAAKLILTAERTGQAKGDPDVPRPGRISIQTHTL